MTSDVVFVAAALIKSWFPRQSEDQEWISSPDGQNWSQIALADAAIAIESYKHWIDKKYAY